MNGLQSNQEEESLTKGKHISEWERRRGATGQYAKAPNFIYICLDLRLNQQNN